ncbi:MAG: sodium-dependent bicarbonate transport family permease, partial [Proteobacteria bacterium]|nr:sodium-dependent bicarbonate transport family permease [Pseudomonadota bacterium]
GVELSKYNILELLPSTFIVILIGVLIPLIAFPILKFVGKLNHFDSASIAAHYGSVSVVTYSVALAALAERGMTHEGYIVVYLVLLEMPAIIVGVALARMAPDATKKAAGWGKLMHEVFSGKSILLLTGGLVIGWIAGEKGFAPIEPMFGGLFKGALALFLLEMGLVAASRVAAFRSYGMFLVVFAMVMPIISAAIGIFTGFMLSLSPGGTALLATLYASASYIAAPAAMRIAVPKANPSLSIGASLGVTFPFNLFVGIPLYFGAVERFF